MDFELGVFCRRWFDAEPTSVEQLTIGTFNETSRVQLSSGETIIVRLGPPGEKGIETGAAALALVGALGSLVPRTLALDTVGDRQVTAQSVVSGTPASERVLEFSDEQSRQYFRELGWVTRILHAVTGEVFGGLLEPGNASWADSVATRLRGRIRDYQDAGLDTAALTLLLDGVPSMRGELDSARPSLLHGDLWSLNILLDDAGRISGIVDWDAASWGDPLADWTLHRIRQRAGTAAEAFWETYGELPHDSDVRTIYATALNTSGSRLDIERRNLDVAEIPPEHWDLEPTAQAFEQLAR